MTFAVEKKTKSQFHDTSIDDFFGDLYKAAFQKKKYQTWQIPVTAK